MENKVNNCENCLNRDAKYLIMMEKDLASKNKIIIILIIVSFIKNMFLLYLFTTFNTYNVNTTNINNEKGIANYNESGQIALAKKEVK